MIPIKETLRAAFGREHIDALVNNAGNSANVPFMETTEQEFDSLMNVHLKGVFFLTQALAPLLVDGGAILNLSSGLARFALPGKAANTALGRVGQPDDIGTAVAALLSGGMDWVNGVTVEASGGMFI